MFPPLTRAVILGTVCFALAFVTGQASAFYGWFVVPFSF